MELQFFERNVSSGKAEARVDRIEAICRSSVLFEELLYRLVEQNFQLNLMLLSPDNVLALGVFDEGRNAECLGSVFIPAEQLETRYRPVLVPAEFCAPPTPEHEAAVDEWLDQRDKRLRLHIHQKCWDSIYIGAAASMPALLLSYVLVPGGWGKLSRCIQELPGNRHRFCIKLSLRLFSDKSKYHLNESVYIELEKVRVLVERRLAKHQEKHPSPLVLQ